MTEIHEALRRWAKGLYPLEAGVELLVQAFDGRFANPWQPWVQRDDDRGWWWIDVAQMTEDNYGALSGGETRLLRIAASLLGGASVDLGEILAVLDGSESASSSPPSTTPTASQDTSQGRNRRDEARPAGFPLPLPSVSLSTA